MILDDEFSICINLNKNIKVNIYGGALMKTYSKYLMFRY